MRLLLAGGVYAYRALFSWYRPALFIGTLLAAPLFQMLFYAYLGRQLKVADDAFYIVGNAALAACGPCIFGGTMAIASERRYGTLNYIILSPRSRTLIFLGRALPYAANGLLVAVFVLAVGVLLLDSPIPARAWPGLGLCLLIASLSASFFGLVIGSVSLRFRDAWFISNSVAGLMILLTGAVVPRTEMPAILQRIGDLLPLTRAVQAARALADGDSLWSVLPTLGGEVLFAAAYATLAAVLLRVFEAENRRTASLQSV